MNIRREFLWVGAVLLIAGLTLASSTGNAQATSAALTGTVFDASGAVVPKAEVSLKNEASGDLRRTVSNQEGYFTFAAIPPGSYTITVEMAGFTTWEVKSVVLNSGDKRNVMGIKLAVSAKKETVVVEGAAQVTPVDSGEVSTLISENTLQNVAIVGQNAAEFLKIMPGMAFTGGVVNQSSYAAADERTGNGPVGNFAPNGLRVAALDITSDGAHIVDPGCNCGQAMNTNAEMTSELKVLTSNFGADESKGPVVVTAIGKSGGQQFHGEAYLYSRYYSLNANDWLYKQKGSDAQGQPFAGRPETKYFYPGVQIGGPVILPWTNFNRNRQKLFFFFGTEYYKQNVDNGIYQAVVPTAAMRNGDFSQMLNGKPYVSWLNGGGVTKVPNNRGFVSGVLPSNLIDANGLRLMNTYPLPNVDPSIRGNQGFNYVNAQTRFSNMLQFRSRVDYSINDSTKLYVSYNRQTDNAEESLDTLWTGNAQSWASPTTPYPTPIIESSHSEVVTVNLTKVINPTLTNELVFSDTYLNLPNTLQDPSKVSRAGLGLNYQMLFNHPNQDQLIFPQMVGWGQGISNMLNAGFELSGTVYARKTLPSVSDNVSKVWKTHTSKFGFYWERTWNEQPGNGVVNGAATFAPWAAGSTGNVYADMLIGQMQSYQEQNFNTVPAFRYITTEFYGQDSWKLSRRFTLEYGIRLSHLGPWSDTTGFGFAAWYPSLYSNNPADINKLTGLEWNKINPSTPLSGSKSRLLFYNPRAGFAWDIFGSGRTVLRGGYGMYHFHDEQNVQNPAYGITQGSFTTSKQNPTFNTIATASSTSSAPSTAALDPNDDRQPRTQSYSLTVAERLPWKSVLEVAYVGSTSDQLSNWNNNFSQINAIQIGGLFTANGWVPGGYSTNQVNQARPLQNYGTLKVVNHQMYSNYNSMQVSWNKQSGPLTFLTNYTFSKALGIRGENGAATGDPTNLRTTTERFRTTARTFSMSPMPMNFPSWPMLTGS